MKDKNINFILFILGTIGIPILEYSFTNIHNHQLKKIIIGFCSHCYCFYFKLFNLDYDCQMVLPSGSYFMQFFHNLHFSYNSYNCTCHSDSGISTQGHCLVFYTHAYTLNIFLTSLAYIRYCNSLQLHST